MYKYFLIIVFVFLSACSINWGQITPKELQELIDDGYNFSQRDSNRNTPLILAACQNKNPVILDMILQQKVNIDDYNTFGTTALMCAVSNDLEKNVSLLIKRNANTHKKNKRNESLLHLAAYRPLNSDIYESILKQQINVDDKNIDNETALFIAVKNNNNKASAYLIEADADVNTYDNLGNTPLIISTKNQNVKIVKMLLDADANINTSTFSGERAFPENILFYKNNYITQLFLNHSSEIDKCDLLMYNIKNRSDNDIYLQSWIRKECPIYKYFGVSKKDVLREAGTPYDTYKTGNIEVISYVKKASEYVPLSSNTTSIRGDCVTNYRTGRTVCDPDRYVTSYDGGYTITQTDMLMLLFERDLLTDVKFSTQRNTQ